MPPPQMVPALPCQRPSCQSASPAFADPRRPPGVGVCLEEVHVDPDLPAFAASRVERRRSLPLAPPLVEGGAIGGEGACAGHARLRHLLRDRHRVIPLQQGVGLVAVGVGNPGHDDVDPALRPVRQCVGGERQGRVDIGPHTGEEPLKRANGPRAVRAASPLTGWPRPRLKGATAVGRRSSLGT